MEKALFKGKSSAAVETICFRCVAPRARWVRLVADFNDWSPRANPLERQLDGSWTLRLPLTAGRHLYLFLVDGETVLDPEAMCVYSNERHEKVSLIAIS